MKLIDLPVSHTSQISFNFAELPSPDEEGKVLLGGISYPDSVEAITIARKNGAQVVFAAIDISQKIERIIANYFFGQSMYPPKVKSFFQHEILESPQITFQFKKELLKKIVKEGCLFSNEGKAKNIFFQDLDTISAWRNAFAHGSLIYDSKKGVILNYYAKSPQNLELSEQFWENVEGSFESVQSQLNKLVAHKF